MSLMLSVDVFYSYVLLIEQHLCWMIGHWFNLSQWFERRFFKKFTMTDGCKPSDGNSSHDPLGQVISTVLLRKNVTFEETE